MSEQELYNKKSPPQPGTDGGRYFQIDVMKVLMMMLVILDHSTTHDFLHEYASPFWERIAIPALMVIMGFNICQSFNKLEDKSLKSLYSKEYFKKKISRYVIPYLFLYLLQGILAIVTADNVGIMINNFPYDHESLRYLGYTAFWGPGMWYIPVLFGSILVLPLLYKCFYHKPLLTLVGTFIVELGVQLLVYFLYRDVTVLVGIWGGYIWNGWWYTKNFFISNIFFLISGVGLGMWISRDTRLISKNSIPIWILLPVSIFYLYLYSFVDDYRTIFHLTWLSGDYHFLSFPWSAFLILLFLAIFPKKEPQVVGKVFRKISNSTYHILLTQILYFSYWYHYKFSIWNGYNATPEKYLWFYPLNLVITFTVGVLWYSAERWFYRSKETSKLLKIVYFLLIGAGFVFYLAWIISSIAIFFAYPLPDSLVLI